MRAVAVVDGMVQPLAEARVPVADRGFLYGDSVFEVLRTHHGVLVFAAQHVDRLMAGAAALGVTIERSGVISALSDAMHAAQCGADEQALVRVVVTRGVGAGLDVPVGIVPSIVVTAEPLHLDETALARGIDAIALPEGEAVGRVPGLKTGAYLGNVLARRSAAAAGAAEAILMDAAGRLVEGAGSNVIARIGSTWWTAPGAVLAGITRREAMALAAELGFAIREEAPAAGEVEEIAVTSSVRGIVPIRRLREGPRTLFSAEDFPATARLRDAYAARVRQHARARPSW